MLDPVAYVFRWDLRLKDSVALARALQLGRPLHAYVSLDVYHWGRNPHAWAFELDCLEELRESLGGKLSVFQRQGDLAKALVASGYDEVHWNAHPCLALQDSELSEALGPRARASHRDHSLSSEPTVTMSTGRPYRVFTAFHKALRADPPIRSAALPAVFSQPKARGDAELRRLEPRSDARARRQLRGGRAAALRILAEIRRGKFDSYGKNRDYLDLQKTTKLSAYMRSGCVSIRECFQVASRSRDLQREIAYRDFYYEIEMDEPKYVRGVPYHESRQVRWKKPDATMALLRSHATGEELVDAATRELVATGWMHNRARMVLAWYLRSRDVDWRVGQDYLAGLLTDHDPVMNGAGWQWMYTVGAHSLEPWRRYSIARQTEKYDPQGAYRARWRGGRVTASST